MSPSSPPLVRIPTGDEHPVWGDVYEGAAGRGPGGVVVLCHGMKGHRRWGFIPALARALQSAGITAVAIDFSHNGVCGGDAGAGGGPVYRRPDLVRRNTIDRERRDLSAAVAWVARGGDGMLRPGVPTGLWGHSRGGTSVLLNAMDDPCGIAAIATWSAPAHADIYQPRQKERWRRAGEYDWLEGEGDERLAMGVCFLDDLEAHREEYALADRSAALEIPHLVVHGEVDLVIPVENAHRFARARAGDARVKVVILRTGHTFGVGRRDGGAALAAAIAETVEWFGRHLSGKEVRR